MVEITANIKQASIYIDSGNYDKALDLLDKELEQNPKNINAFYYKGSALIHKGDLVKKYEIKKSYLESGIQYFEKLITLKGENPGYDFSKAIKELKEAKEELDKL